MKKSLDIFDNLFIYPYALCTQSHTIFFMCPHQQFQYQQAPSSQEDSLAQYYSIHGKAQWANWKINVKDQAYMFQFSYSDWQRQWEVYLAWRSWYES